MNTHTLYQRGEELDTKPAQRKTTYVQLPTTSTLPKLSDSKKKNLAVEGVEDANKESIKVEKLNEDRLKHLVKAANHTLVTAKSIFPFDFFPDEISVEITQVNVAKHYFIATAHLQTVPIKNVADVFVDTSPFFAALKIIDSSYIENSIQIDYLKKDEACFVRRIIQGLVIAHKEGIDLAKIPKDILVKNIEALGKAANVERGVS